MSQAEARSWWADVQHLRPDAPTGVEAATLEPETPAFDVSPDDELGQRRRGRITGRQLADTGETHLNRADAAFFGEALSLDEPALESDDRRTIHITGTPDLPPVRRLHEVDRRHGRDASERLAGGRPDRIAMWSVALGIFLVLLAALSSSADAAVHFVH